MLKLNDKVVYPGHGVGTVQEILGSNSKFYKIQIESSGTNVLVPLSKVEELGVKPVDPTLTVETVKRYVDNAKLQVNHPTWNARYRAYMDLIRSGEFLGLIQVYAELLQLRTEKQLSFGERKMYDLARTLLIEQVAVAMHQSQVDTEIQFNQVIES